MKVIKGKKARQWKMRQSWDSRAEMISLLIPLGLEALKQEFLKEIEAHVGSCYSRKNHGRRRWGKNPGSVFLGDVKVPLEIPRVRDTKNNREIALKSYEYFQDSQRIDDQIFRRVIKGLSSRDYESACQQAPGVFGLKKSTISKTFVRASAAKLKELMERRFD